jgi:5-hydroxyisourate hydrolase
MGLITTHILDIQLGQPAVGVAVKLEILQDGQWRQLDHGVTDKNGRIRDFLPDSAFDEGIYQLTFNSGSYFAGRGMATFYPKVAVIFEIQDRNQHYHVPLLLSPFGYSTYRGK